MTSVPDIATLSELVRIETLLQKPGNAPAALRSLKGLVSSDMGLRKAWELGVKAFKGVRYEYEPPAATRRRIIEGQVHLSNGDRQAALRIARELVAKDANTKQAWELGLAAFQ
jgi:hypothetical protein